MSIALVIRGPAGRALSRAGRAGRARPIANDMFGGRVLNVSYGNISKCLMFRTEI